MSTLDFFRAIMPEEGVYYLALIDKNTGRVAHRAFSTLEELTFGVAEFDKSESLNVYHACASYKEPFVEVDGKKKYRVPENWHKAKSFWIDLDCGEDKVAKGDGYLTKRDAAEAVVRFCTEHDFPRPMFVDSGNGVHCYWPLTKSIKPEVWKALANALKAVLAAAGVLADPTCTADFSRILRPVGSHNKKGEFKVVEAKSFVEPIAPEDFAARLQSIVSKLDVVPERVKQETEDLNDDLTAHLPVQIPSYATEVANHCPQVAKMRDTQGDVSYDHWRGVIGIIFHCEEGIELAHEWSARREETGHSQNDVDIRYNTWNAGPTTCEFFSKCNPSACEGCLHKGKVTSPIILGRIVPEPKAQDVEAIVDGEKVTVEIPPLPKGYKYENGQMARLMQDKDGIMHALVFCNDLFYPTHRIRKENGEFALAMRMHLPDSRTNDFMLDTAALASSNDLLRGLGKYEVVQSNNKDANVHLTAYMRDSLAKLKAEAEELNTLVQFGWRDGMNSFLLGDRLYHKDGTVRKVLVGGNARTMAAAFPQPHGTLEGYSKSLNFMYANPGMVPLQYVIASGFGSILTPLGPSIYKGLMMAVVGRKPGSGKTTVCMAQLYAFGDAGKMKIGTEKGTTENAMNTILSTYQNIPFLFDEFTHIDPKAFSTLAYRISQGEDKKRNTITKSGVGAAESASWALCPPVTANTDLHALLASSDMDSEAEAVRVIQINVDNYNLPKLTIAEAEAAMKQMELNAGVAGDVYLRYVVSHLDEVLDIMGKWGARYEHAVPDLKYRFYRLHAVCSMAALEITNKLGITEFDLEAVYAFSVKLFRELADTVATQNSTSPEDAWNDMIKDMNQQIITTYEYRAVGDSRGPETPVKRIYGTPIGRYIIGSQHSKTPELSGKLFIAKKEIPAWCLKTRMNYKEMMAYAQQVGFLSPVDHKFTIGRGSTEKTGNTTVVCIDMNKLENLVGSEVKLTLHVVDNAGTGAKEAVS